jgi:hypothetical protein
MGREEARVDGEVVATATDGSFVARAGGSYVAYDARRRRGRPIPAAAHAPQELVSVSVGARWLARAESEGWVSLWDLTTGDIVWRGDPGPSPSGQSLQWLAGPAARALLSTGAPAFVGDSTLLTLHSGAVIALDLRTGRRRCGLADRGLGMVRRAVDLGEGLVALSSSSLGNPEIGNRLWVIASVVDCRVVGRVLGGPSEAVGATQRHGRTYLASEDRARILEDDRHFVLELDFAITSFGATRDGSHLLFGLRDGGVATWSVAAERLTMLRSSAERDVVRVWDDGRSVLAATSDARIVSWPLPDGSTGTRRAARLLTSVERRWEDAIIEAAVGDRDRALAMLEPFERDTRGLRYRAPAAYVRAILTEEEPSRFRARTRGSGIAFADSSVLEVAQSFADYQLTMWGADVLLYHFADRGEGLSGGAEVGCELVRQLDEIDQVELAELLRQRLGRLYPDHPEVHQLLGQLREPIASP